MKKPKNQTFSEYRQEIQGPEGEHSKETLLPLGVSMKLRRPLRPIPFSISSLPQTLHQKKKKKKNQIQDIKFGTSIALDQINNTDQHQ